MGSLAERCCLKEGFDASPSFRCLDEPDMRRLKRKSSEVLCMTHQEVFCLVRERKIHEAEELYDLAREISRGGDDKLLNYCSGGNGEKKKGLQKIIDSVWELDSGAASAEELDARHRRPLGEQALLELQRRARRPQPKDTEKTVLEVLDSCTGGLTAIADAGLRRRGTQSRISRFSEPSKDSAMLFDHFDRQAEILFRPRSGLWRLRDFFEGDRIGQCDHRYRVSELHDAMSPPQKDTREILERTRMCKYWKAKRCTLGADCKFAHSVAELKQQPDLVATQLCFQFSRKGRCKNGEACKFAHGRSELRRFPNASGNETPTKAHKEQSLHKESHETPSIVPPVLKSGVVQILPGQPAQSDPEPQATGIASLLCLIKDRWTYPSLWTRARAGATTTRAPTLLVACRQQLNMAKTEPSPALEGGLRLPRSEAGWQAMLKAGVAQPAAAFAMLSEEEKASSAAELRLGSGCGVMPWRSSSVDFDSSSWIVEMPQEPAFEHDTFDNRPSEEKVVRLWAKDHIEDKQLMAVLNSLEACQHTVVETKGFFIKNNSMRVTGTKERSSKHLMGPVSSMTCIFLISMPCTRTYL
eukprot:s2193_g2.t2